MVCQRMEDRLFDQLVLEHMQGSKGNERGKKEKREEEEGRARSEHFPSSNFNRRKSTVQLPIGAHYRGPSSCPLTTGKPQVQDGSGWRCVLVAVEVSKGKAERREWMYPIDEMEEEEECWMCG